MNLSQYPFIRFTFLLILGFLLAPVFEPYKEFIPWLFGILSLFYLMLSKYWKSIRLPQLFTLKKILLALILITGGFIRKIETNPLKEENHISKQLHDNNPGKYDFILKESENKENEVGNRFGIQEQILLPNPKPNFVNIRKLIPSEYKYIARVSTFPNEKNNNFKTELEIEFIYKDKVWKTSSGKIFATFKTDSLHKHIPEYGDRLIIHGAPQKITSTGNPGQFDPAAYFALHGIFHKQKVKNWKVIGKNYKTNPVYDLSQKCRVFLKNQLTLYINDPRSCSVASSVLLGDKTQLDNALMQAYSRTGAMHVLAVSGLHVAILFIILQHLTSFLLRLRNGNHLQTGVIFLLLFFYGFLTGLSPSVLRSVFMFSLILISKTFQRQSHILNTLFSSAFFLLLYNPMFLYDVGFQLSYTAVISIVLFQKPINSLIYTKNKIVGFVWNITSVSLAAQVFTLPITLGCFGQYPVYSLLSNLLVIPLSTFILYGGTALFSVSFIPWVAKGVGFILNFLLLIMNNGILWIEKLPFASLEVPMFDYMKVLTLYGIILSLLLFFRTRILVFFACFVFFSGFIIFKLKKEEVQMKNRRELIIYNARSQFLMEINKGYESEIYSDAPESDSIVQNVYLKPSFHNRGVKSYSYFYMNHPDTSKWESSFRLILLKGKKIAWVKNTKLTSGSDSFIVNSEVLILEDKKISKSNLKKILAEFKPGYLVTSGYLSRYIKNYITEECKLRGIRFYNINERGAFHLN